MITAILIGVKWSYCGFDLHFPDDWWCWGCFRITVNHSYVFFPSCLLWLSIQILCPVFNSTVGFLLLSFMSSIYILDINSFQISGLQIIFSHFLGWLFICWLFLFCDAVPLGYYHFRCLYFWCHIQKFTVKNSVKTHFPSVFF